MANVQHRFLMQPQLCCQTVRGLTLHHPPNQQHGLLHRHLPFLKHRPAVQIVGLLTLIAAIHRQAAFLRPSKAVGLLHACSAAGAFQSVGMEVFQQPPLTCFSTEEVNDWEFHTSQFITQLTLPTVEPSSNRSITLIDISPVARACSLARLSASSACVKRPISSLTAPIKCSFSWWY